MNREDLRARFGERFITTARARIERTRADGVDIGVLASELHALAGEAALLEYPECARLARAAEDHARAGERRPCEAAIDALEARIRNLG